jgi:xanthine dehydrogenase accessory factor
MIEELAAAVARGDSVVLATVVRTSRSVPRRAGSKMLVFADGQTIGTVGGGAMEHRVTLEAAEILAAGRPRLVSYELLDPSAGDPGVCGGDVDIYMEPYMPIPTLFIVGGGHVGKAVGELAHWLGFRSVIWDDRKDLTDELTDNDAIDATLSGEAGAAIAESSLTANDSIVIVSRDVALDVEILPLVLETPAGYVGLMGSNRRWQTTRSKLEEMGSTDLDLSRVHTPIGLEIHAETPEEIAVSVLAQVIGHRRGG